MTWLVWRQVRTASTLALAATGALTVLLVLTRPGLVGEFQTSGLAACLLGDRPSVGALTCGDLERLFLGRHSQLRALGPLLLVIPLLFGVLLGAPATARELESGTHRFAWVQGVSRGRWLIGRAVLPMAIAAAATGLLSLAWTWWSAPSDRLGSRIDPGAFAQRGVAPLAYAVFAVALGVLAGAVVRRVVPALALTIAGYGAVRVFVQTTIRPRLATAVDLRYETFTFFASDPPGLRATEQGWLLSAKTVDAAGAIITDGGLIRPDAALRLCGVTSDALAKAELDACGTRLGLENVVSVVPADEFWSLQLWEAAIFLALAAALVAAARWWVRNRLS